MLELYQTNNVSTERKKEVVIAFGFSKDTLAFHEV